MGHLYYILSMWLTSIHCLTVEVCNVLQESPNLTVRGDKLRHSCPRLLLPRSCVNPMVLSVMYNVTSHQMNVGVWTKMVMRFLEQELSDFSSAFQLVIESCVLW